MAYMKSLIHPLFIAGLLSISLLACTEKNDYQPKTTTNMKQVLIDKLTVPTKAKEVFVKRMNINRDIIHRQPGFVKDEVFEQENENGTSVFVTVAVWADAASIKKAKETVSEEYRKTGFDLAKFCEENHIVIDRGIYHPSEN